MVLWFDGLVWCPGAVFPAKAEIHQAIGLSFFQKSRRDWALRAMNTSRALRFINATLTLRLINATLTLRLINACCARFINSAGWRIYEELISLLHQKPLPLCEAENYPRQLTGLPKISPIYNL